MLAVWVVAPAVVQTTIQRRLRALALYVVEPDRSSARTMQIAQRRTPASAIRHTQTTQQRSSINQSVNFYSGLMGLLQLRYERDSSTIRARFGYNTLRGFCALAYEIDSSTPRESVVGVSCMLTDSSMHKIFTLCLYRPTLHRVCEYARNCLYKRNSMPICRVYNYSL